MGRYRRYDLIIVAPPSMGSRMDCWIAGLIDLRPKYFGVVGLTTERGSIPLKQNKWKNSKRSLWKPLRVYY